MNARASGPAGTPAGGAAPAYLVRGSDPSLLAQAVHGLLARLAGADDPALVVEEHGGQPGEEIDVDALVSACRTPAFLAARRIVVARGAGRLDSPAARRLGEYLDDPLATTVLVLVSGGGTIPQPLVAKVAGAGEVIDTDTGTGRARRSWLAEQLGEAPVRLAPEAVDRLDRHLGGDLARLEGLLAILASAYGDSARIGAAELAPFLGEEGDTAPWELTDAIDAAGTPAALSLLHRMLGAGGLHPLQVMAILHRHYESMLRLDGLSLARPDDAAQVLGTRSTFAASKVLAQSRRLGPARLAQAIVLLAEADLDLKGATACAPEVVLEVLVARLSRLVRPSPGQHRRQRRR